MNLADLGNIGEFVASIGVVISLIYLAVQIRSQNNESKTAITNNLTQQWSALMRTVATDPRFADLWLVGIEDFTALSPGDRVRFACFLTQFAQITESLLNHHLEGKLNEGIWNGYEGRVKAILPNPGVIQWWAIRKDWFSPALQVYFDTVIDEKSEAHSWDAYKESS